MEHTLIRKANIHLSCVCACLECCCGECVCLLLMRDPIVGKAAATAQLSCSDCAQAPTIYGPRRARHFSLLLLYYICPLLRAAADEFNKQTPPGGLKMKSPARGRN